MVSMMIELEFKKNFLKTKEIQLKQNTVYLLNSVEEKFTISRFLINLLKVDAKKVSNFL